MDDPQAPLPPPHSSAFDEYTVLHALAGFLLTYFARMSVGWAVILNQVFVLWESSQSSPRNWGIARAARVRPVDDLDLGPEAAVNSAMDTLFFTVGALVGARLRAWSDAKEEATSRTAAGGVCVPAALGSAAASKATSAIAA